MAMACLYRGAASGGTALILRTPCRVFAGMRIDVDLPVSPVGHKNGLHDQRLTIDCKRLPPASVWNEGARQSF
jgi:hypothetical protein